MTWSYEHSRFRTLTDGYNHLNIGDIIVFKSRCQIVVLSIDRQKNLIIACSNQMNRQVYYLELATTERHFRALYRFMMLLKD